MNLQVSSSYCLTVEFKDGPPEPLLDDTSAIFWQRAAIFDTMLRQQLIQTVRDSTEVPTVNNSQRVDIYGCDGLRPEPRQLRVFNCRIQIEVIYPRRQNMEEQWTNQKGN